ncbi:MAG: HECT domain-containing protein, partial [Clostridia bacterium]|nr:HECT domain-containing protein [Clostridia bacterium]
MKKRLIKKLSAVMLSVLGLSALSFGVAGCAPKSTVVDKPENIEITKLAPPDDGSLPTAHTCAENLAYINYVFDRQPQYQTYSYGVTSASIATQPTRTFRDF